MKQIFDDIAYYVIYGWISIKIFFIKSFLWVETKWKEYEKFRLEMLVDFENYKSNQQKKK